MRKALLPVLAAVAVAASVGGAYAQPSGDNIPTISLIPDVIVGDTGDPSNQTAPKYLVFYDGLDLANYITDEDGLGTIKAGFQLYAAEDRNLSIGSRASAGAGPRAISQLTAAQLAAFRAQTASLPAHKNIMATSTVLTFRAVADYWDPMGPTVDLDYGLGLFGTAGDQALVALLVEDDESNTASKDFLVKCSVNTTSALAHEALMTTSTGGVWEIPPWVFTGLDIPVFNPPWWPPTNDGTLPDRDYLYIRTGHVPNTATCFGFWEAPFSLNSGRGWLDGVVRLRWLVEYTDAVATTQTFKLRSRLYSDTGLDKTNYLYSEQELAPVGAAPDINIDPFLNRQSVLPHYLYAGADPDQLALNGDISMAIDAVDFAEYINGSFHTTTRGCTVRVDMLGIEVLDHAALSGQEDVEYDTLYEATGEDLHNWVRTGGIGLGGNSAGMFSYYNTTEGVDVELTTNSFSILGLLLVNNTQEAVVPGELVRATITLRDNLPSTYTANGRPWWRLRLYIDGNYEQNAMLNLASGLPLVGPAYGTIGQPGTTYECYMESPLAYVGNNWGISFDTIQETGAAARRRGDYSVLDAKLQHILLPY